jgi:hypothetical protein
VHVSISLVLMRTSRVCNVYLHGLQADGASVDCSCGALSAHDGLAGVGTGKSI